MHLELINLRQAIWLLVTSITVTYHLLFVRFAGFYAGRNSWISLVVATLTGLGSLLIVIMLMHRRPGQNLIQLSVTLFGRWVGRAVGVIFIWYFLHVTALLVRNFGDFMRLVMPETPILVLVGVGLALVTYSARHGIEVIARANDVILPVLVLTGSLASIMLTKDKQYHYLLPILEHGWVPVMRGGLALQGLLAETVLLAMFGACLRPAARPYYKGLWSMLAISLLAVGPITGPVAVFGIESVRAMTYPTFEEIKHINVAEFLANLDVMGILLWTLGSFVKATVLLWAAASGVATLCHLKDHRSITTPLAFIIGVLAYWVADSNIEMNYFLRAVFPVYSITVGVGLPLVLLLWSVICSR